jgi:hypothetical protein
MDETWRLIVWIKAIKGMVVAYEDFPSDRALCDYVAKKHNDWNHVIVHHEAERRTIPPTEIARYNLKFDRSGQWILINKYD